MEIVRYAARDTVHIGIREEGKVAPLRWATSMGQVLARPLDGLRELLDDRGSAVAEDAAGATARTGGGGPSGGGVG